MTTVATARTKDICSISALCIDPDRVSEIWLHVREFIAAAFWGDRGDDDADVVLADLLARRSLLWIAWGDEGAILAAATTKLINVSRGTICLVTSCGGRNLKRWHGCLADIEAYARAEGCTHVRMEGRKGWRSFFPDYHEPWIVLQKKL